MVAERNPVTGQIQEWVPPADIADIFFKYRCRISDISKACNISRETFYQQLKRDPEFKALFESVESQMDRQWVEDAEKTLWYVNTLADKRPSVALNAAQYILNRKGKIKGWGEGEGTVSSQFEAQMSKYMQQLRISQGLPALNTAETSINAEAKSQ